MDIWSDDLGVTIKELDRAVRCLGVRNTGPGPDGIPGKAWVLALRAGLGNRMRQVSTSYLRNTCRADQRAFAAGRAQPVGRPFRLPTGAVDSGRDLTCPHESVRFF